MRGRNFTDREGSRRSGVAIVNHALAERVWPDGSAVGKRFRLSADAPDTFFRVIGIARDILTWDFSDRPVPTVYLPYPYLAVGDPIITIRAATNPAAMAGPVRVVIRATHPTWPILDVYTMTDVERQTFWHHRLLYGLFGTFAVAALLLAVIGFRCNWSLRARSR